mgnify:CR=1 FL=1
MTNNILLPKYTLTGGVYRLAMPMDIGDLISEDDSVRLLNAVLERMDYRNLHAAYSRLGRIETPPKKNEAKMQEKMKIVLPKIATEFGLRFHVGEKIRVKDLKKLLQRLYALKGDIEFVKGKGKRKSSLQRAVEAVEEYLARQSSTTVITIPLVTGTASPKQTMMPLLCG